MKISIITAAFRAEYMDRVLQTLLNQTYKDFEWVIVNDGQEGIRQWYKEARESGKLDNIKAWFIDMEQQKGRFGLFARNVGVMACNYRRILFLDDDNEFEPDHIQSLVDAELTTGKIPFCWMFIKGKKPESTFRKIKRTGFSRQGIDLACVLYKKEFFEQYGYFRDDAQVTFDWNAIERIYNGVGGDKAFVCTGKPTLIFWHKRY